MVDSPCHVPSQEGNTMQVVVMTGVDLANMVDHMRVILMDYSSSPVPVHSLKFAIDPIDRGLIIKVNNGTWSPAIGRIQ